MVQLVFHKHITRYRRWGMRYFNRLLLGTILVVFISLPLLYILWIINTEKHMATVEEFCVEEKYLNTSVLYFP